MYEVMFYGGLGLAAALLIAAAFFFILFKIPSVHQYFIKYSHRGLVQAAAQKGEVQTKSFPPVRAAAPKRVAPVAKSKPDEKTELSEAVQILKQVGQPDRPGPAPPQWEDAVEEDGPTQLLEWAEIPGQTEILERTEILLDKTELLQVWAGPSGEKTELLEEETGSDLT